jgi:cytochrome c-type biogenesis protein CcmF
MIPEIGYFAIALALAMSLVQGVAPLVGAARGNALLMGLARPAARGQFLFIAIAYAALTYSFVTSDFSVSVVASNSHTLKPMMYKISGVWANHEGSMLMWVLILAGYGLMVAEFGKNLPPSLRARVLGVHGLIGLGFLAFILFTSNPFTRLDPAPLQGQGLNPLLQDPGLAFHPPFLYLGYVGFSMAFSFAMAALIEGRVDPAWARWVRPWTLAAWCALTLGIAMGSWWAYYELGWGGWWFWDPVENASFMPWLAGTALLHSAIVAEKRNALKSWTVLLAILTFALSILGAFLVRSGVLTSVHAFATDPTRGMFILGLLVIIVGGALTLYMIRAPELKGGGLFAPISREGALVLNNLLLATGAGVVLLGTLYPLALDAVGGGKVSVGAPFFTATFVPIMTPILVACAIGPVLGWKRGDLGAALKRLRLALLVAVAVVLVSWYMAAGNQVFAALGIGAAAWLIVGAVSELVGRLGLFKVSFAAVLRRAANLPRGAWGTAIAHAGLGVFVAGVTASSSWQTEKIQLMRIGDSVPLAEYTITFEGTKDLKGPNYEVVRGDFTVRRGDKIIARLSPEKRYYPAERSRTTEAAIHTTWLSDIYTVLGNQDPSGAWSTRFYLNPLVPWIWFGTLMMTLGGLTSLTDRRLRIGAPRRARKPSAPAAPPIVTGAEG